MGIHRLFKNSGPPAESFKTLNHKVYYVGLPKTGSSSIYAMLYNFGPNHEFMFAEAMNTIWMRIKENLPDEAWHDFINSRNHANEFKPDISTFNHYFIPSLSNTEQNVKYIYSFRDCKSWINSFVNFTAYQLAVLPSEIWHEMYVDLLFEKTILKTGDYDPMQGKVPKSFYSKKFYALSNAGAFSPLKYLDRNSILAALNTHQTEEDWLNNNHNKLRNEKEVIAFFEFLNSGKK